MTCSVACVLRRGGDFTREHVVALYQGVSHHWPKGLPLRFVALSDTPIDVPGIEYRPLRNSARGWWAKMELFEAAQDDLGDILYFDLDTMIVGSLEHVVGVGGLTLLADFNRPQLLQSGVMYLPAKARPYVYATWLEDPKGIMKQFRGDGEFLDAVWQGVAQTWQDAVPRRVVSYKVHVRKTGTLPPLASVVCFHGQPRPWQTPLWNQVL